MVRARSRKAFNLLLANTLGTGTLSLNEVLDTAYPNKFGGAWWDTHKRSIDTTGSAATLNPQGLHYLLMQQGFSAWQPQIKEALSEYHVPIDEGDGRITKYFPTRKRDDHITFNGSIYVTEIDRVQGKKAWVH